MPRPIPDDVENVTGFIWYLIPIPDDPVFVQAAWDAFSELTYPWNWGKEGRVPDSDVAAQLWSDAIYEALRVRDMGFPDILLDYLDEVEPLLRQIAESDFCCDALPGADTIYTDLPSGLETSDTDTDTSTFPTGIADQSEWDEYICRAATAFVDSFIEIPDQVTGAISATIQVLTLIVIVFTTGAYIGIAGAIGGLLTITGILEALGYLEEIIDGLTAGTEDTPSAVQTELLAVRDDLICDIVTSATNTEAGGKFRATMASAVTSTAWENLLLLLASDPWFAKIYNHDAETAPDATCVCEEVVQSITYDFDSGNEGWVNDTQSTPVNWNSTPGADYNGGTGFIQAGNNEDFKSPNFIAQACTTIRMDFWAQTRAGGNTAFELQVYRAEDNVLVANHGTSNVDANGWNQVGPNNDAVSEPQQAYYLKIITDSNAWPNIDHVVVEFIS